MELSIRTGLVLIIDFIAYIIKFFVMGEENYRRFQPIAGPTIGIILAILVMTFYPSISLEMFGSTNIYDAIMAGFGSGMMATGGDQLISGIGANLKNEFKKANNIKDEEPLNQDEVDHEVPHNDADNQKPDEKKKPTPIEDGIDIRH